MWHMNGTSVTSQLGAVLLLMLFTASDTIAQEIFTRKASDWHVAIFGGPALYQGDQEVIALDRGVYGSGFGAEIEHKFSRKAGLGLRATAFSHPRIAESDQYRSSLEAFLRLTQQALPRLSPFVEAGVHFVIGADRGGSGPVVGAGLNFMLSHSLSLFVSGNVNLTYPGDVLDNSATSDHFDAMVLTRAGFRITDIRGFFGGRSPVRVLAINHEPEIETGIPITFGVELNRQNPTASVLWDFGDGGTGVGHSAEHTYLNPGLYRASLHVEDARSEVTRFFTITVGGHVEAVQPTSPLPEVVIDSWIDLTDVEIHHPKVWTAHEEMAAEAPEPVVSPAQPVVGEIQQRISGFTWVVASRPTVAEAQSIAETYRRTDSMVHIVPATVREDQWYRICLGLYESRGAAQSNRATLPANAPSDAWITFIDSIIPISPGN